MHFMQAATLATDLFRFSYQTVDAVNQNQLPQPISDRIMRAFKNHIALLDPLFAIGEYTNTFSLSVWIVPLRIAVIAQGIYLLQSDPNADSQAIQSDIILNLINISRVAAAALNPQAALAFAVGDAAYRLHNLYSNRTVIGDKLQGMIDGGPAQMFELLKGLVSDGGEYLVRAALAITFIAVAYFRGLEVLKNMTDLPSKTIHEIVGWTALTSVSTLFIAEAAHKIFNDMGLQPSSKRRIVELSVSFICSSALMGAIAVGLGRASSMTVIYKPIMQAALTTALACSIAYLFKTAISEILDAFGVPPGILRSFEEWSFTVVASLTLTAIASPGLGITQSISESVILMLRTSMVAIAGGIFMGTSLAAATRTFFFGIPSCDELDDWFAYIK